MLLTGCEQEVNGLIAMEADDAMTEKNWFQAICDICGSYASTTPIFDDI